MATSSLASTVKGTWWRASPARLGWVESCAATGTVDFIENRFKATATWSLVAKIGTEMIATLESSSTNLEADVLSLEVFINRCGTMFTFGGLTFTGFLLPRTAALTTLVSSTI